ncbi:DUF4142 domain-containing protein [Rhodopila globiformis]|uniref:DUF4142 domain-containing protein n=1 Tax=Rhodopila globiformis TaxID=1071 RepID=A0A2S6NEY9_RHOGL|nr:DUF4142 domain-containing protein [Rhodopila globiformis]PPQ33188.1 hypothetical protein CCS01_14825 [Rhodopila globiformis]
MNAKYTLAALVISAALPGAALAQSNTNTNESQSSQHFLQQVARDNMHEMHEAMLAEWKAQDPAVKGYARLIVDDHSMLTSQLSALQGAQPFEQWHNAKNEGQQGMRNGEEHAGNEQHAGNKLWNLSGAQFDRAFIDHEAKTNEQSVKAWQQEANSNQNNDVTAFAKLGLPVQQEHLALAQAIQTQLDNGQNKQASR